MAPDRILGQGAEQTSTEKNNYGHILRFVESGPLSTEPSSTFSTAPIINKITRPSVPHRHTCQPLCEIKSASTTNPALGETSNVVGNPHLEGPPIFLHTIIPTTPRIYKPSPLTNTFVSQKTLDSLQSETAVSRDVGSDVLEHLVLSQQIQQSSSHQNSSDHRTKWSYSTNGTGSASHTPRINRKHWKGVSRRNTSPKEPSVGCAEIVRCDIPSVNHSPSSLYLQTSDVRQDGSVQTQKGTYTTHRRHKNIISVISSKIRTDLRLGGKKGDFQFHPNPSNCRPTAKKCNTHSSAITTTMDTKIGSRTPSSPTYVPDSTGTRNSNDIFVRKETVIKRKCSVSSEDQAESLCTENEHDRTNVGRSTGDKMLGDNEPRKGSSVVRRLTGRLERKRSFMGSGNGGRKHGSQTPRSVKKRMGKFGSKTFSGMVDQIRGGRTDPSKNVGSGGGGSGESVDDGDAILSPWECGIRQVASNGDKGSHDEHRSFAL